MTAGDVEIHVLGAEHEREAALLCSEALVGPDAWPHMDAERAGLLEPRTPEELYSSWIKGLAGQAVRSRTSVVAVDGGRVVAAALNEDYGGLGHVPAVSAAAPKPGHAQKLSDFYCFELLRELPSHYAQASRFTDTRTLHIAAVAVAPSHGGRGIASRLVARSEEIARAAGYKLAVAEAANPRSQSVFRKEGYRVEAATRYADWTCPHGHAGGARPYSSTPPSLSCALVVKDLEL
eukprot:tig00021522_g22110.t1